MDAQQILAQSKKHHFWIISGVVVVAALVCWWWANSALSDEYTKGKGAIDGKFSLMEAVSRKPNHPNDKFAEGVKVEHEQLKALTLEAWEALYVLQDKQLKWPKIDNEFFRVVPKLKPEEDIPAPLLEKFMNFIKDHLPELYDIVKLRPPTRFPIISTFQIVTQTIQILPPSLPTFPLFHHVNINHQHHRAHNQSR